MLQRVAPELWIADQPLKIMGAQFGARMTVIRLGSGGLFIHSPIDLTQELRAELAALGPVQAIVAPNTYHHMFLPAFVRAYPQAQAFAAEGVARKQPEVQFQGVLGDLPEFLWGKELDQHRIAGQPKVNEVAFLHRDTRTLVLTDWLFNFNRSEGWWTRAFLRLAGALGGPLQSKLLRLSVADKAAARASRDHLLTWDFDRIIVAHGDIIESDGKAVLQRATAWLG